MYPFLALSLSLYIYILMYGGTLKNTCLLALAGDTTTTVTYADACVLYIRNHMWGGLPFQAALLAVGVGRYTPRLRIGSVRLSTICCPSPQGLWERKWDPGPKLWSEYAVTTRNVRAEYADWRDNCFEEVAPRG